MLAFALVFVGCSLRMARGQAAAVSNNFSVDEWQVEDGLPDNRVTAITQTRDGYLWFGTFNGVVRFDGMRFTVFDARTPGLLSGRIMSLFADSAGGLWVGMEYGELARYAAGKFTAFGPAQGWNKNMVVRFAEPRSGEIFVGTHAGGLLQFSNQRFVPVLADASENARKAAQFSGSMNLAVNAEENPVLWARTAEGLKFFRNGQWELYSLPDRTPPVEIMALMPARRGGLWVSATGRLLLLQNNNRPVLRGELPDRSRAGISGMAEDSSGNVWLTSWGHGLFRIAPDGAAQKFSGPERVPEFLRCVFEDREGNIWVGSNGDGLLRLKPRVFTSHVLEAPLPSYRCTVLAENPAGGLWVGTDGRGLVEWKGNQFSAPLPLANMSPEQSVWALTTEPSGRLWIGSYGAGVIVKDDKKSFRYQLPEGLTNNRVFALARMRDGAMWIGTSLGLNRYADGAFETFDESKGMARGGVRAIVEDASGDWWFGTAGGGVARWRDSAFQVFTRTNGLLHNSVRCLHADADGSIWIGNNGGLNRWRNNRFENFSADHGLPDANIGSILDDGLGHLWFGSDRGVFRIARAQFDAVARGKIARLECTRYLKGDGLASVQCSEGSFSAIRASDGRLWFATVKGISVVNPRELRTNSVPPPVHIEEVLVDGQMQNVPLGATAISIPAGRHRIDIRYAALSFTAPEKVRFKLRLEGFDTRWQEVEEQRATSFQGLPPGDYRFHVIAANNDGLWNNEGASLAFTVQPKLWQRGWFRGALAAAFFVFAFMMVRARIVRLQRQQAAQREFSRGLIESQEQERKRIAAELHDSLGQNLLVIKNRVVMAKNTGADAREELDEIGRLATQSLEEVREISQNLRPYQLDRLGLTRALHGLVKKVSASSSVQFTSDIAPLDRVFPSEAETNLFRIVQEALNNVLKHSGATEAQVWVKRGEAAVNVIIADNGRGFDWTAKQSDVAHGMGLSGIAERVRILSGHLKIDSTPGKGTTLTIAVPIPKAKA